MFDNESFINEVSKEESIWNIENKLYHDKNAKHVSWTKVARASIKDFDELEEIFKSKKIMVLQKKWRSFRDSYRRKCVTKSGQASKKSTPYIYANILGFLTPTMQNRTTESNVEPSDDEVSEEKEGETEDVGLIVGKNITIEEVMDDTGAEEQPPRKKKKTLIKNPPSNFGTSLLKILQNRQTIPEDPEKCFLMSLLPQIKSLTEGQKSMVYIEFLNTIQRVKHYSSAMPHSYNPSNAPINQPNSYYSQQHLSSLGYYYANDSQNVPTAIINSTITSPQSLHDESSNFSEPPSPAINSTKKQNSYNFSNMSSPTPQNMSTPPIHHSHHYINNYSQPTSPYNYSNKNTP